MHEDHLGPPGVGVGGDASRITPQRGSRHGSAQAPGRRRCGSEMHSMVVLSLCSRSSSLGGSARPPGCKDHCAREPRAECFPDAHSPARRHLRPLQQPKHGPCSALAGSSLRGSGSREAQPQVRLARDAARTSRVAPSIQSQATVPTCASLCLSFSPSLPPFPPGGAPGLTGFTSRRGRSSVVGTSLAVSRPAVPGASQAPDSPRKCPEQRQCPARSENSPGTALSERG